VGVGIGVQGTKGKHDKACFYLGGSIFRILCRGVPHVPKILVVDKPGQKW